MQINKHFILSLVKSAFRINGCLLAFLMFNSPTTIVLIAAWFLAAEVVGILEEIGA